MTNSELKKRATEYLVCFSNDEDGFSSLERMLLYGWVALIMMAMVKMILS